METDIIFRRGEHCDGMYVVEEGLVFVTDRKADALADKRMSNVNQAVGPDEDTQVLGEMDVLRALDANSHGERELTALADEISRLLYLSIEVFHDLIEVDAKFAEALRKYARNKLHDEKIHQNAHKTSEEVVEPLSPHGSEEPRSVHELIGRLREVEDRVSGEVARLHEKLDDALTVQKTRTTGKKTKGARSTERTVPDQEGFNSVAPVAAEGQREALHT